MSSEPVCHIKNIIDHKFSWKVLCSTPKILGTEINLQVLTV